MHNWETAKIAGCQYAQRDHVREELEQAILTGAYDDGARLDENSLSTRFAVSRTPIREALQMLAASGLVELIARRGAFVRHPGFVELLEMFEVMAELEALCGRLAARRLTDTALDSLKQAEQILFRRSENRRYRCLLQSQ